MMLKENTYEKLARANAAALNGLQPKISVWNTGPSSSSSADSANHSADLTAPIRNLFQSLPPLFSTIQDQTGIRPPNWLAQVPANASNGEGAGAGQVEG